MLKVSDLIEKERCHFGNQKFRFFLLGVDDSLILLLHLGMLLLWMKLRHESQVQTGKASRSAANSHELILLEEPKSSVFSEGAFESLRENSVFWPETSEFFRQFLYLLLKLVNEELLSKTRLISWLAICRFPLFSKLIFSHSFPRTLLTWFCRSCWFFFFTETDGCFFGLAWRHDERLCKRCV